MLVLVGEGEKKKKEDTVGSGFLRWNGLGGTNAGLENDIVSWAVFCPIFASLVCPLGLAPGPPSRPKGIWLQLLSVLALSLCYA